jgi:hypothetical protein
MSRKFLTPLDLVQNELQNARVQNLATAPVAPTPVKGQMYFNSTDNTLYWYNGSTWVAASAGAGGPPTGAAGGDLAGSTYPNPVIAALAVTDAKVAAANKDGAVGTPSMRTLGTGAQQALAGSTRLDQITAPTAPVSLNSQKITALAAPSAATDAANKTYVDSLVSGLGWKDAVRVATTANITLSAAQTIDSIAVGAGDRVLVKNQTTPAQNGIYVVQTGAWTRATDADVEDELVQAAVFVEAGTQQDTGWVCTNDAIGFTLGTTPIAWVQFTGAGQINAGQGMTKTGNTLDVGAGSGVTVAADTVAVDTAVIATRAYADGLVAAKTGKYAVNVGGATSQVITHNLNSLDVVVAVYRNSTPWDTVDCDMERTTVNTVTLRFAVAPAANEYRAVVIG